MNAEDDDAQLVAYIDRELDQPDREALEARLAREPSLRERLAQLERGERPFAAAFKVLLDAAPLERLQASLAAIESREEPETSVQPARGLRLGGLAAAAAILLFVGGLVIGRYGFPAPEKSQSEDWRQAVAEYASLYTSDTFAALPPPREDNVAAFGAKLGVDLSLARVELAGLQFKGAVLFARDGAPLGQLAYIDPASGPVLFCIIHDSEPDAAVAISEREGFATASWADRGHGYMLIGRLPQSRTAELAGALRQRF